MSIRMSPTLQKARETLTRDLAAARRGAESSESGLQDSLWLLKNALAELDGAMAQAPSTGSDDRSIETFITAVRKARMAAERPLPMLDASGATRFLLDWAALVGDCERAIPLKLQGTGRALVERRLDTVRRTLEALKRSVTQAQTESAKDARESEAVTQARRAVADARQLDSQDAAQTHQRELARLQRLLVDTNRAFVHETREIERTLSGISGGRASLATSAALASARRAMAELEGDARRANALGDELGALAKRIAALELAPDSYSQEDAILAARSNVLNALESLGQAADDVRRELQVARRHAEQAKEDAARTPVKGLAGLGTQPAVTSSAQSKAERARTASQGADARDARIVSELRKILEETEANERRLEEALRASTPTKGSDDSRRKVLRELEAAKSLRRRSSSSLERHERIAAKPTPEWTSARIATDLAAVREDVEHASKAMAKVTGLVRTLQAEAQKTQASAGARDAKNDDKVPVTTARSPSTHAGDVSKAAASRPVRTRSALSRDPFAGMAAVVSPTLGRSDVLARSVSPRLAATAEHSDRLASDLSRLDAEVHRVRPFIPDAHVELHASVAALDVRIERAKGRQGRELAESTRDVALSLGEMAALAERIGLQSAATLKSVQRLMDERREALARLAVGEGPEGRASQAGHAALDHVAKQLPGLGKVLPSKARSTGAQARAARLTNSLGAGSLTRLETASRGRSQDALFGIIAGRTGSESLGRVEGLGALTVNDVLMGKLGQPYAKSWFSSVSSSFKGAVGGLAKVGQSAVKSGLSTLKQAANTAKTLGSKAISGAQTVAGGIAKLQKKAVNTALSVAVKGAGAGWNLVKKTSKALGGGMRKLSSSLGQAASMAWDSTKQVARVIGSGASALAEKTGSALKSAWKGVTGVVGAVGGKIKRGLSTAASWVGDKVKKAGGALLGAAKWAGKKFLEHHPLGKTIAWGWDKFGKKAWDKTKSLAKAAWDGTKTLRTAVGGFLQSPAGQLLTSGLSIAATFIPGGLVVKAGIGAIVGAIEAVSKGGGLKEALLGAAMGGLEGALPLMKLKTVGKLALGATKGGLQAAINGGGMGDIALGALGGAAQFGGMAVLKKVGGGRGVKMVDKFMTGASEHKGVLGRLQRVAQKGGIQKLYSGVQNLSPKIVKAAGWVYDKSGKLHKGLQVAEKVGKYTKGALEGVAYLSSAGASLFGEDSRGRRFLEDVSALTQRGAERLEKPLEYVKQVDDVVEKVHKYTGMGLKFVGVDPKKQQRDAARKREIQRNIRASIESNPNYTEDERARKLRELDAKTSTFDRVDNWFANKTNNVSTRTSELLRSTRSSANRVIGSSKYGPEVFKFARAVGEFGSKAHAHTQTISKIVGNGLGYAEGIRDNLRDFILMTEGAEEDGYGGGFIKWAHENAAQLEKKLDSGISTAKKVKSVADIVIDGGGAVLDATGNKEKRKTYDEKAEVWWGVKKPHEGSATVSGKFGAKGGEGETVVAPWVKRGETAKERVLGTPADPTKTQANLKKLDEWRQKLKREVDRAEKYKSLVDGSDDASLVNSRMRGGQRMLGGGEKDERADDWKAYKERKTEAEAASRTSDAGAAAQRAGGAVASGPSAKQAEAQDVVRQVGEQAAQKSEEQAQSAAREVEKDEKHAIRDAEDERAHDDAVDEKQTRAHAAAESNDEMQAIFVAIMRLEQAKAAAIDVAKDSERPPAIAPAHRTEALILLGRIEGLAHSEGLDLSEERDRVLELMAFFNGGKPFHAEDDRTPALERVGGGLGAGGLELATDDEGVAGRVQKPQSGGLEGVSATDDVSLTLVEDERFSLATTYLDEWERRVEEELPALEDLALTDTDGALALYQALLRAGRLSQVEIERLGRIVRAQEPAAATLVAFAERYAAVRRRLRALRPRLDPSTEPESAPSADEATDVEQVLVDAGGDESYETTPALDVAPAEDDGGETYLGEFVGDTWIGSGAAARPIADGLANNFKFDDIDGVQPTIGGALARLGGALQGLGGSVRGAADDAGGLMGELKQTGGLLGDMGGTVGELIGRGRDNDFTQAMERAGEWSDWVSAGAGKVGGYGDKVTGAGEKLTEAGHKLEQNGLRLFGKVYRKGKAGTGVAQSTQTAAAGGYLDAPKRLDHAVTMQMERFLGANFRSVKIHTGEGAELITRRYQAEAVTIKDHIFFAPGRYNPASLEGQKLLAHELTHVKQRTRANLDTRTAEEEAHKAEALFGNPDMDVLDLSHPQADFQLSMAGAESGPAGVRTAKKQRSVRAGSGSHDEPAEGEELLDLVGERVYELMMEELERDFENH